MRQRLLQLAAWSAVAVALAASPLGSAAAVRDGGTFRVGIPADAFDTIDWALVGSPAPFVALRTTCASLMTYPDRPLPGGLTLAPEIAAGFPRVTDGGRTYTFRIRRGLRFSTGAPITARDVAHTIDRVLSPLMKAYAGGFLREIVGAQDVLSGKASTTRGVVARGDTLTIRLTRPLGDFAARLATQCVIPENLPPDPEGARAPIPAAGPYYVAQYLPGVRVILERNRFYAGDRPHHVDRIVVDLEGDATSFLDRVERGDLDYAWLPTGDYGVRAETLSRTYGINRGRFFTAPASFLRFFSLNTSRPLFRDNVKLRQAVNFAVDRRALLRERGPLAGHLTDQYLPKGIAGYRDARIYPLEAPDLAKARALARGNLRGGRAVLYAPATPLGAAQAQIVQSNLARIGLVVVIKQFPPSLFFEKIVTRGEPFDIAWNGWLADLPDPESMLNSLFEGRSIGAPNGANSANFDSPRYNALLARAARLSGAQRYSAYGALDVDLARAAAPAIAYAYDNALTFVSARTGCVVVNPYLDLAAVCLR